MAMAKPIRFILLGGFLGAGKTTALLRLAAHYGSRGLRVGIITNDQAEGLVDTLAFRKAGFTTEEIPSGCFCCHFDELIAASGRLADGLEPDVILAEPVGSCTDLVNAVIAPLKDLYADRFAVAPYATMLDPHRAADALSASGPTGFSKKVTYLYKMQQNEADIVAVNKVDQLDGEGRDRVAALVAQNFPQAECVFISALTGAGFDEFTALLDGPAEVGRHPVEVDYGRYAEAEVSLGWLNARVILTGASPWDGNEFLAAFGGTVRDGLTRAGGQIAHFKMRLLDGQDGEAAIHGTANGGGLDVTRRIDGPLERGTLVINLRAEGLPEMLEDSVVGALDEAGAALGLRWRVEQLRAFAPRPPAPPTPSRNRTPTG